MKTRKKKTRNGKPPIFQEGYTTPSTVGLSHPNGVFVVMLDVVCPISTDSGEECYSQEHPEEQHSE